MWRFRGCIDTEWSFDEVVYRQRKVGEKAVYDRNGNFKGMKDEFETYQGYIPKSGHGHCSFDILVNAIDKSKETLPDNLIDLSELNTGKLIDIKDNHTSLKIKPATTSRDSQYVSDVIEAELEYKALACSFPVTSIEVAHQHISSQYNFDEDENTRSIFYVPFVYVIYSYKGDTFEWGFFQTPSNDGWYETPKDENNIIEEQKIKNQKEWDKFKTKYYIFLSLSAVFTFLLGMIVFAFCNDSLYERIKKRYTNQNNLVALLDKLRRKEQLAKRGVDTSQLDIELPDRYEDGDGCEDDDFTPRSIADVQSYFAFTESLKQQFKKRMRLFWILYFSIITFIITLIAGAYGYSLYLIELDRQKKDLIKEECQRQKAEERNKLASQLERAIRKSFAEEFVGKTFIKDPLQSLDAIFDTSSLEVIFLNDNQLTCNEVTYSYTIKIEPNIQDINGKQVAEPTCEVAWGDYRIENIFGNSSLKYDLPLKEDIHFPFFYGLKVKQNDKEYVLYKKNDYDVNDFFNHD